MSLGFGRDGFEFRELGRSLLVCSLKMAGGFDGRISDRFSLMFDDFELLV